MKKNPTVFKTILVLIGCVVVVLGVFSFLNYREGATSVTPNRTQSENTFWTYEYQPLGMKVTLKSEWKEIPTASLVLPQNFSGARFAFKKENTSCVLAYVTAPEAVYEGYINVTEAMAKAGSITDAQLLTNIPNSNIEGPHEIDAMIPEERMKYHQEQLASGTIQAPVTFYDLGVIFVSSHFPDFMENSRQSPLFVLFDDGTSGVAFDGHCLSDMVRVLKNLDSI